MNNKTQLPTILICLAYSFPGHSQAFNKPCTLVNTSSLVIQQVDENWNPVPFDCDNIKVTIESDDFLKTIKPGKYIDCPYLNQKINRMPVLFEKPGTYQVTVSRFDEISVFKQVVVHLDESGCHTVSQLIEVQFDMTKKALQ